MIYEHHFLQNTYLVEKCKYVVDHVDGVTVNDDRQNKVQWPTWNECQQCFVGVDEGWKLASLFDDMEKVNLGSLDDMEVERMGPVVRPVLDMEVGLGGGALTLKQRWTELVRGYLVPRIE